MVAGEVNRTSRQTEGIAVIREHLFLLMPTTSVSPLMLRFFFHSSLIELCMTLASTL